MSASETLNVIVGNRRAEFTRIEGGWTPTWFYEGDRPMLRFKDHEWLSIGHVHPATADRVERTPDGGAVFHAVTAYGKTPVEWSVRVAPDAQGAGFLVECRLRPRASIELLEAYSTFETPYEYDGTETATTVIGMNPVSCWRGAERISPPVWENPAWIYARPQGARMTGPCSTPLLCQALTSAGAIADRFVTIVGDWNVCRTQDIHATPTRNTPRDPASTFVNDAPLRGYKYYMGALNWSSAYAKDPNVLFEGGVEYVQRLTIDFGGAVPGGTLDRMLLRAWERAAAFDTPADGRIVAYDRATQRGVSWQSATQWLREVFCADKYTEGLYHPEKGICTYAKGSRPKAGGDYSWFWWPQWAGLLHYRARMTDDKVLQKLCDRNDLRFAEMAGTINAFTDGGIASKVTSLPALWWLAGPGRGGVLHVAFRAMLRGALEFSASENGKLRTFDYGAQAATAEALLLGGEAYEDTAMRAQGMRLLEETRARLDDRFWQFNVGRSDSLAHGGQIRSLGHGHAIMANLVAYRQTGDRRFLEDAHRFARYLLAISYATHNGSADPDFDWRGWCNGSNAGRDQIAEFPPWETQSGLLCIGALMAEEELEGAFYDAIWTIARTGLAQFPAARSLKRVLDTDMRPRFVPREEIASERDFYDILPYLAYENPHDQTLQASYQGSDCMVGEFVYGGGLARSSDDRIVALVPRAAHLDLRESEERRVQLWNPTQRDITTTVTARWPGGGESVSTMAVPARRVVRLTLRP